MSEYVTTKEVLMQHIEQNWQTLMSWLSTLTPHQLIEIRNIDGWALKDHIAHMAAWENSVISFLQHEPRHKGLDIPEEIYLRENFNEINDLIFQQHKDAPYEAILRHFMTLHAQLLALLTPLTTEDLQRPYRYYLPDESGEDSGSPAINVVYGNTAHHYRLHQGWMEEMLHK